MTTQTITVRKTTVADLGAVDALFAKSYPKLLAADYAPSVLVTALPLLSRAQPQLLASGCYYLAERDGKVLGAGGFSFYGPMGDYSDGTAHIRHVVTDAASTRQGIGRSIMTRVLKDAARQGARRFDCISTLTAVRFYASLGFRVADDVVINLRPGISFPAVQMRRFAG
ncbi:MAG: GNAT family N-acetyltransferase [Marinosulfonomonas sp.]